VLWSVPWQYLTFAGITLFFVATARFVLLPFFAIISALCNRYKHAFWGEFIRIGTFRWTVALFRTGMCWLAYTLLKLPSNWTAVLDYIVPLPFIFCTFFWCDVVFETVTNITKREFSEMRTRAVGAAAALNEDKVANSAPTSNAAKVVNTRATAWTENLRVLKYFSFIVLFLLGLAIEGVDIVNFLQSATLLGLILSFALQPWMRNLVGGMHVFADEKYVLGNRIRVGGIEGRVEAITLRTTTLKRDDDSVAYIPNSRMMDLPVTNCSARRHRVLQVTIALDRNSDTANVRTLMRQIGASLQTLSEVFTAYLNEDKRELAVFLNAALEITVRAFLKKEDDNELMVTKMQSEINLCVLENMKQCNVKAAAVVVGNNNKHGSSRTKTTTIITEDEDNDHAMSTFAFFSVA
jgi:small-conductance mechanosensitive channel